MINVIIKKIELNNIGKIIYKRDLHLTPAKNREKTKMKNIIVTGISVAETIEFLISNKSKSITGQNINVDSGTI